MKGVRLDVYKRQDSTLLLCTLETAEGTDRTFFFPTRPQDVRFPATRVRCLERGEDFVTVQAEHYAHAVSLDGDYVFAEIGRAHV